MNNKAKLIFENTKLPQLSNERAAELAAKEAAEVAATKAAEQQNLGSALPVRASAASERRPPRDHPTTMNPRFVDSGVAHINPPIQRRCVGGFAAMQKGVQRFSYGGGYMEEAPAVLSGGLPSYAIDPWGHPLVPGYGHVRVMQRVMQPPPLLPPPGAIRMRMHPASLSMHPSGSADELHGVPYSHRAYDKEYDHGDARPAQGLGWRGNGSDAGDTAAGGRDMRWGPRGNHRVAAAEHAASRLASRPPLTGPTNQRAEPHSMNCEGVPIGADALPYFASDILLSFSHSCCQKPIPPLFPYHHSQSHRHINPEGVRSNLFRCYLF